MKVKKLIFIIAAALLLAACSESGAKEPSDNSQAQKTVANQENIEGLVKAISDEDIRYKMMINDELYFSIVSDKFSLKGTSYGFDEPYKLGTSTYAFADEKGLNEEQGDALFNLLSPSEDVIDEIRKENKSNFSDDGYPFKGVDFDYITLANIDVEEIEDEDAAKIVAEATIHWHSKDGKEKTKTFETSAKPDDTDTEIEEQWIENATNADKMNEEIPTEDRFIYVEE